MSDCIENSSRKSREIWIKTYGKIPFGLFVLHHCDNKKCINLEHLFLGTQQDNLKDMSIKDRSTRGERSVHAKLTSMDVIKIRKSSLSLNKLAKKYSVSKSCICHIRLRNSWKHV